MAWESLPQVHIAAEWNCVPTEPHAVTLIVEPSDDPKLVRLRFDKSAVLIVGRDVLAAALALMESR